MLHLIETLLTWLPGHGSSLSTLPVLLVSNDHLLKQKIFVPSILVVLVSRWEGESIPTLPCTVLSV